MCHKRLEVLLNPVFEVHISEAHGIAYCPTIAALECAIKAPNAIKNIFKVLMYLFYGFGTPFPVTVIAQPWKDR